MKEPEILWPRWADRLEAVGEIGIARCFYYSIHNGDALYNESTPQCMTVDEILATATQKRLDNYQKNDGKSKSMMDHYYDKLIQIACPPKHIVRNYYLQNIALLRAQPLFKICVDYSKICKIKDSAEKCVAEYVFFRYMHSLCIKHGLITKEDEMFDVDFAIQQYLLS